METSLVLLCTQADEEVLVNQSSDKKLAFVERTILRQINLFVDVLLLFYGLENQVKSERDLKRDLLTNLVTNLVLSSEVYFLVYNLQTQNQEQNIKKLRTLVNN